MNIPYTFIPYIGASRGSEAGSAPVAIKTRFGSRGISISDGKPKPVRKAKNLLKGACCAWYEAEDRNMPSVSSF
jgi:hypothetical protein